MKLNFTDKFEIDINNGENTLRGVYKRLTKKQEAELQEEFKEQTNKEKLVFNKTKELNKLRGKFEIARAESQFKDLSAEQEKKLLEDMKIFLNDINIIDEELTDLQDELNEYDLSERIAKHRIVKSVTLDEDNKELINLCIDAVGSAEVYQTIIKAVEEGKQKDSKN